MKFIKDQILGGTHLDRDGEKLPIDFLENFVSAIAGRRMPVHQQHDMSKPVVGYIENVRLVGDESLAGEWLVVGDVTYEEGSLESIKGGFSISGTIHLYSPKTATAFIYLPSPYHSDISVIEELKTEQGLIIGRWVKKSEGLSEWVVIGSAFVIMFGTPLWQQVYDKYIFHRLEELLEKFEKTLSKKGLKPEIVQIASYQGRRVEVRFVSDGTKPKSIGGEQMRGALEEAENYLLNEPRASDPGVDRLVLYYDSGISTYKIHRVEFCDGNVEHST